MMVCMWAGTFVVCTEWSKSIRPSFSGYGLLGAAATDTCGCWCGVGTGHLLPGIGRFQLVKQCLYGSGVLCGG